MPLKQSGKAMGFLPLFSWQYARMLLQQTSTSKTKKPMNNHDNLEKFSDLLHKLGIRQTGRPTCTEKPRYKTCGLNTKIGISDYWSVLFQANELLPDSRKLTDTDILYAVRAEYPNHPPAQRATERTVRQKRTRYNNGRLTGEPQPKPATKSVAYN